MIVKNEQKVISRCLDCVKQFADEIIIVDTGSTDNTKQIASKYTNKVFDFKWCDDFSKARNFSYSLASKDYIMWLDADDIIKSSEVEKIKKLKLNMNADTYMFKYTTCFDKDGKPLFSFYRERIVKRSLNLKWQGFVHEAIVPTGKIEYLDINIEHKKLDNMYSKRNLVLFRKAMIRGVEFSCREQYYYSRELFYWGYYKSAIKQFNKFLKMKNKFLPNIIDTYFMLSKCYQFTNQYYKAKQVLIECINLYTPINEIVCELANIFVKEGKYDVAAYYYESALNIEKKTKLGFFVKEEYYYLIPLTQLTSIYYKLGDYKKAETYHNKSKELYKDNEIVKYNSKFFQD